MGDFPIHPGCRLPSAWRRPEGDGGTPWLPGCLGGLGSAAPMQGGAGLWQLVRMLLAFGSCFVRTRLRPWQRTRSQGPAGGVSSAPTTLMEALETEQLPSLGALSFASSPNASPASASAHLSDHQQEAPWGLHPHPQQAPHSPGAELSEELRGHVRAAFILDLQSLRSFPESSQPPDFPPKFPIRRPHTERQAAALHELGLVRGIEED